MFRSMCRKTGEKPSERFAMRVAHLLRKYNPAEWGGTETAVKRLLDGLHHHGAYSVVFGPKSDYSAEHDPLVDTGYEVKRFHAFVPVSRISEIQRARLIAIGGNL